MNDSKNPEPSSGANWDFRSDLEDFIEQFNKEVATELDAVEYLRRAVTKDNPLKCGSCGSSNLMHEYGSRADKCIDCGTEIWLTSGTFFGGAKKLKHWVAYIALIQEKFLISQAGFARAFGVSQSTAWATFHSISEVLKDVMDDELYVSGSIQFLDLFTKRSKETEVGLHPISEEAEVGARLKAQKLQEMGVEVLADASTSSDNSEPETENIPSLSDAQKLLYESLRRKRKHLNFICTETNLPEEQVVNDLIMLGFLGLVTSLGGNWFQRTCDLHLEESGLVPVIDDPRQRRVINRLIVTIKKAHHGCSRKYLQNYLAVYWCLIDRETWSENALWRVASAADFPKLKNVVAYVTPKTVHFVAA